MEYRTASFFIIGTELTNGIISDKHGKLMGEELTRRGYKVLETILVPDDADISSILAHVMKSSDVVLVTGGLGPTADDMTRKVFAEAAGVGLSRNEEAWQALLARIGSRAYGANESQIFIPDGFEVLPNPNGTAPGFCGFIDRGRRSVFCAAMPGPPREMEPMFRNYVLPKLEELRGTDFTPREEYSVYEIPEAKLEELTEEVTRPGLVWGTRFQDFRISLYLSGGSADDRAAAISALRNKAGDGLIVDGNHESVDLFIDTLKGKKGTLAVAESVTGGLLAKLLTDRAGASGWFLEGLVTYTDRAKNRILGVPQAVLDGPGAVSPECAAAMAEGALRVSGADYAISSTGFAGPTGDDIGLVYFGFASKGAPTQTVGLHVLSTSRIQSRHRMATAVFVLGSLYLEGGNLLDTVSRWKYI